MPVRSGRYQPSSRVTNADGAVVSASDQATGNKPIAGRSDAESPAGGGSVSLTAQFHYVGRRRNSGDS